MIQLDWDIPSSCQECRFSVDGWCYAIRAEDSQPSELCYLTRPEWCPLRDAAPRWHRVEEPPKESGKQYAVWASKGYAYCDKWLGDRWLISSVAPETVTHWMPIEPPKEDA